MRFPRPHMRSVVLTIGWLVVVVLLAGQLATQQGRSLAAIERRFDDRIVLAARDVETARAQAHALGKTVTPEVLTAYLQNASGIRGTRFYLLDSRDRLMLTNSTVPDPALPAAARAPHGGYDSGGVQRRFSQATTNGAPWHLVMTVPKSKLLEPVSGVGRWLPWAILGALALGGLLVVRLLARLLGTRQRLQLDVAQRISAERALASSEELYRTIVRALPEAGVMLFDRHLRFRLVEGQGLEHLGLDSSIIGRTVRDVLGPEGAEAFEPAYRGALDGEHRTLEWRTTDGERTFAVEVGPASGPSGEVTGGLVVARDISVQRAMESELQRLAHEDGLTGLWNRRRFEQEVDRQVDRGRRYGERAALLLLDLDHFKEVNDAYGHSTGDALLRHVATVLRARLRSSDSVARLGGDEFALLIPGVSPDEAASAAESLIAHLRDNPLTCDGVTLPLTTSVGIAFLDRHTTDGREVLRVADVAMYDAKASGRDRISGLRQRAYESVQPVADADHLPPLRAFHCDDSESYRRLLSVMLSAHPDLEMVGQAGTADEALQAVADAEPDVIVLDANVPGNSVETIRELRACCPDARILVLSGLDHPDATIVRDADAFAAKSCSFDEIADALRALDPRTGAPPLVR